MSRPTRLPRSDRSGAGTCARCSTSSGRRSSSSASCSPRVRTSCRRTSSPSCAASRTTSARSPSHRFASSIEGELGLTLEQAFVSFDEQPIAAASIGQVHRAVLPNGDEVVVKVQRPNAPRQIESDLALLYQAARMIKERVRALDFIDAQALVDEFASFIRQELDYKLEARHADTFRRNFADSDARRGAEGLLGLLRRPAAHARVPRRSPARRSRRST